MSRGGGGTGLPPLASRGGSGGDRPSGGMRHVTFGAGGAAAPAAGGTRQFTSAGGAGEARSASAEREARRATVHDLTEGPIRSNNSGPLAGGGGGGYGYGALINRPRLGGGAGDLALAAAASATASPPRRPVLAGPGGRQGSMPRLQRNSLGEEPSDMVSPIRKQLVQGGPGSGPLVQRQASMPVGQRTAGARAVAAAAAAAVAAADGQEGSTYGGLLPNIRRNSHGQAYDPAALLGSPLRGNMDPHAHQQQQLAQQAPAADRQTRMVQLRDELERQVSADPFAGGLIVDMDNRVYELVCGCMAHMEIMRCGRVGTHLASCTPSCHTVRGTEALQQAAQHVREQGQRQLGCSTAVGSTGGDRCARGGELDQGGPIQHLQGRPLVSPRQCSPTPCFAVLSHVIT